LNIRMAGIDYSLASIPIREKFSLTTSHEASVYRALEADSQILGAVIVSTCNRTELYLSCADKYECNPFCILCGALGMDFEAYHSLHRMRAGDEVFMHLCRLSCGAESQIWGEHQIITQVKSSLSRAREAGATDSILEVLFRNAISAAKKIKTEVKFSGEERSVALRALAFLKESNCKKPLVIGNGVMGRLTAQTLRQNGFPVSMTCRQYENREVDIPEGVSVFDYSDRYERLSEFDAIVSATSSPHYTIELEKLRKCPVIPRLFLDLAVPRDIDPAISDLPVKVVNIDALCSEVLRESHRNQLIEIDRISQKYYRDFMKWADYKFSHACSCGEAPASGDAPVESMVVSILEMQCKERSVRAKLPEKGEPL